MGRPARARKPLRQRLKRWLLVLGVAAPVAGIGLWILVHKVEWLGPLIANTLRALVGSDNVAKLEDGVYAVEDRFNRAVRKDEKPKAYWDVPSGQKGPPGKGTEARPFTLADVGPMLKSWSAPGDGQWVKIEEGMPRAEPPYLYKTLLHPDRNRSWAEVFVVAVDLRRVRVHAVAGSQEPKALEKDAKDYKRLARIPDAHHKDVLGAFNGSFMTEHGNYGMKIDGVTLVKARDKVCTVAAYKDDSLRIGSWPNLAASEADMVWFRQGPTCMYEEGTIHPGLAVDGNARWGATLDGETVIRRSAAGINKQGDVLYVAITNHTTARAIATALKHAGAETVTQLDVNWSYPKFVLFQAEPGSNVRKAVALAKGFEFSDDEYIRKRSMRDFFYLMPKKPADHSARN